MATSSLGWDNFYSTTLSSSITANDTTIPVATPPTATEGFLTIEPNSSSNREIIYYTSVSGSNVVCPSVGAGRGQGGTSAAAHSSGVIVKMNTVAEMFEALQNMTALSLNMSTIGGFNNPYKFSVYHNTTQNITTAGANVAFNTESFDSNSNFASNTYTAPIAGYYFFIAQTAWSATVSQTRCVLYLSINGSGASGIVLGDVSTGAAAFGVNGCDFVNLAANDTVNIFFLPVGATTTLRTGPANTYFAGHLVTKT